MTRFARRPWLAAALALALAACDIALPSATPAPSSPASGSQAPPTSSKAPAASPGPTPSPSFVRPAPTPEPTFTVYTVVRGDTLTSIARRFTTTPRSLAYWNRDRYASLDPDSATYEPDRIEAGWTLRIIPGVSVADEESSGSASVAPLPSIIVPPGPTPRPDGASLVVSSGPRGSNVVALTFDMGGRTDPAVAIVDWLVEHDVPATIFPTGEVLSGTPPGRAVMARIAAHPDLFAVGNHTWDHPDLRTLDAAVVMDQLTRSEDAVENAIGRSTKPFFRPPYGGHDAEVRATAGSAGWAYTVLWDIDTLDWRATADGGPTAEDIAAKVLSRAQGGSIVLMHLGGYHTLDALPGIVSGLRDRGLVPVTLPVMLGVGG
jgi:peptidoglycan/xylan/chitin deacetylase (PgdA/CDA1 family)